jgi:hypothetical protein
MESQTKFYVKSGELQWVGMADDPMDACYKAMDAIKGGTEVDPYFFYVDERGFRQDGRTDMFGGADHWLRTADVEDYIEWEWDNQ